ncbi:Pyruvate dehydrogenase E1 component subunit beta-2 [Nymphaea thermarum]|nr:Pyruvate dehydrogenase E1 component subunit beta-2 [Nymphaea thermarum]
MQKKQMRKEKMPASREGEGRLVSPWMPLQQNKTKSRPLDTNGETKEKTDVKREAIGLDRGRREEAEAEGGTREEERGRREEEEREEGRRKREGGEGGGRREEERGRREEEEGRREGEGGIVEGGRMKGEGGRRKRGGGKGKEGIVEGGRRKREGGKGKEGSWKEGGGKEAEAEEGKEGGGRKGRREGGRRKKGKEGGGCMCYAGWYGSCPGLKVLAPYSSSADIHSKEGISAEVINLLSIRPLDRETIFASVKKTNRLVTVEEGFPQCGVSTEIGQSVMEECFDYLDAPVLRVGGADVPMPYAANLERISLPQVDDIERVVKRQLDVEKKKTKVVQAAAIATEVVPAASGDDGD